MSDSPQPSIVMNPAALAVEANGSGEAGNPSDRRASFRARIGARALVRAPGHAPATTGLPVAVADVSRHGIGFRSPRPMEAGQSCRLTIPESAGHQNREINVVFCRPENGQYFVGAKFAA